MTKRGRGRPRRATPTVAFYCRLDMGLYAAISTCAREWNTTKSAVVNNALASYFENIGIDIPNIEEIA